MQEGLLKVLFVDGARVDADHHEHLAGVPYGETVHDLAATLTSNQL